MLSLKNIIKSIAVICLTAVLFSCSKKIEEVNRLYKENETIPISETKDFKLTYTLSGDKVMILTAPLMVDYTNIKKFPYQYFPDKFKIEIINPGQKNRTVITADKAFVYKNPELAELIGNVQIKGADNSKLETGHLYWDANNKHIFGEEQTTIRQNDEFITGTGFDSSLDFKNVRINKINGILKIKDSL